MSQAKVDRYKEEKRNREKIMKKQKREWLMVKIGCSVVGIVLAVWIGYSVYYTITSSDGAGTAAGETYQINTAALDDFMMTLSADRETEEDTEAVEETEAETEGATEPQETESETATEE